MSVKHSNRAVFLDRDGTIMEDGNYVGDIDRIVLIPQTIKALKLLKDHGYKLFVVTNQSGVGRGFFTTEAVKNIHNHLDELFYQAGVSIDRYYVCPHHPDDNCDCRKPKPKFLQEAISEYHLDPAHCFMIGDRSSDLFAGSNAGIRSVLVLTGVGTETIHQDNVKAVHIAKHIGDAVSWILDQSK